MKTYRRSAGARGLSLGCLALFLALALTHFASGGKLLSVGGIVLTSFTILSLGATLLNLGDRYRIDEEGIEYSNPLLERIGIRLGRRVSWGDVVSVRPYRALRFGHQEESPSALFLTLARGRRFVIDSVESFPEIQTRIASILGRLERGRAGAGEPT